LVKDRVKRGTEQYARRRTLDKIT